MSPPGCRVLRSYISVAPSTSFLPQPLGRMLDKFSGVGGSSMGLLKSIFKPVLLHVLLLLSLVLMVGAPGAAAQDKPAPGRAHAKKSVSVERQSRAGEAGETAE